MPAQSCYAGRQPNIPISESKFLIRKQFEETWQIDAWNCHHNQGIEYFHHPKGFLMLRFSHPSLGNHLSIFHHCVHFLEFYMKRILQYIRILVFCLASFLQPNAFETHPCCYLYQQFVLFYHRVVYCCLACNFPHKMCREQQNHTEIQMVDTSTTLDAQCL